MLGSRWVGLSGPVLGRLFFREREKDEGSVVIETILEINSSKHPGGADVSTIPKGWTMCNDMASWQTCADHGSCFIFILSLKARIMPMWIANAS